MLVKICPKCLSQFECCVDDIANCNCSTIVLPEKTQQQLAAQYDGCLCIDCLKKFLV